MTLTNDEIYSVRYGPKLSLPGAVQTSIAKLRITPMPYKPIRRFTRHTYRARNTNVADTTSSTNSENWRGNVLEDMIRKVKVKDDPEYSEIFGIFNKVSPGNVDKLSGDAIVIMQKRDEEFRLRVTTLLFDRSVTQPTFSAVMAVCAAKINEVIPGISEDIHTHIQMFPKLYDMAETITIDVSNTIDPQDEKLVKWTKQKEKRRGYAKTLIELYSQKLIKEEAVKEALDQIVKELKETLKQKATELTTENVTQFVEFIFETSKKIKGELRDQLKLLIEEIFKVSKEEFKATYPSINMKTKFKLEDALKELNKKE